jgi:hypothetical protein
MNFEKCSIYRNYRRKTNMTEIEKRFSMLPGKDRETIISYGATLRLTSLKKRFFLADQKVKSFENRYKTTLKKFETGGLPDDADHEMHEDYIEWNHWVEAAEKCKKEIALVQGIVQQGLRTEDFSYVVY